MANKNNRKFQKNKGKENIVDVDYTEVNKQEDVKPTFEEGNYVITVVSKGEILKKLAVAGAEVYVTKLADGGLTVDLK
ncbi:hypothetical protein N2W20_000488 [Clostridium perfringens]|uniref:Uncharacterized protein n=1 Tax=Clostridium perfringens TaxID=1502 RepID=A0AAW4IWV5_CLOPF|nr:hypothetical protein [Clostridium perfringens]MDU2659616.1 hypothetical protein [Clostridioides difficile]EHP47396.1 hypothetical protein HMPREF9476_02135 [Clostridium perfringens WAL-14572]EJT5915743.1 hypothetical protein [Clostridium perfringens]EJT6134788.1 hypothetical protein [Clostridium perfringens]EJT6662865.1 hypothetical protein [Clostridium perfringens]